VILQRKFASLRWYRKPDFRTSGSWKAADSRSLDQPSVMTILNEQELKSRLNGGEYTVLTKAVYWRMVSSGMLRRVALVRTDVSDEPSASFIRVTRIGSISSQRASVASYS
jgi:hypothetical protein